MRTLTACGLTFVGVFGTLLGIDHALTRSTDAPAPYAAPILPDLDPSPVAPRVRYRERSERRYPLPYASSARQTLTVQERAYLEHVKGMYRGQRGSASHAPRESHVYVHRDPTTPSPSVAAPSRRGRR